MQGEQGERGKEKRRVGEERGGLGRNVCLDETEALQSVLESC